MTTQERLHIFEIANRVARNECIKSDNIIDDIKRYQIRNERLYTLLKDIKRREK